MIPFIARIPLVTRCGNLIRHFTDCNVNVLQLDKGASYGKQLSPGVTNKNPFERMVLPSEIIIKARVSLTGILKHYLAAL